MMTTPIGDSTESPLSSSVDITASSSSVGPKPGVTYPRFPRLAEYFIVVGAKQPLALLEGPSTGEVLDVLPRPSDDDNPIGGISMFCFPDGVAMKFEEDPVKFHTFVLTGLLGGRLYGFCLVFPERHLLPAAPPGPPPPGHRHWPKYGYVSKCLCIVSQKTFMNTFKRYLASLYLLSKDVEGLTFPLEFHLANLLLETPAPAPGRIDVTFSLPNSPDFTFYQPSRHEFPLIDFSLRSLFECLEVERILQLILCMMLEKKILLYSRHTALLTIVTEGVSALLYPFKWDLVYVPLLSRSLIDHTEAPTPFVMGMHSSYLADIPSNREEMVLVDLDHNRLETTEVLPEFPARDKGELIERLMTHIHPALETIDLAFPAMSANNVELERTPERWTAYHEKRIRASFFMFYADLINGYQFSGDGNGNADESFIAVQPDSSKEFFEKFFGTEMWYSFVEERKKHGDDLFEDFINYREERATRRGKANVADAGRERRRERERELDYLMDRFGSGGGACTHVTVPRPSFAHLAPEREEVVRRILDERRAQARAAAEDESWRRRLEEWNVERKRAREIEREREKERLMNRESPNGSGGFTDAFQSPLSSSPTRQRANSLQQPTTTGMAPQNAPPQYLAPTPQRQAAPVSPRSARVNTLATPLSSSHPERGPSPRPKSPNGAMGPNSGPTPPPRIKRPLTSGQALSTPHLFPLQGRKDMPPPATPGGGGRPAQPQPLLGASRTPVHSTSRQRRDMLEHIHKSQKEFEKREPTDAAGKRPRPSSINLGVQRRGHRRSKSVAIVHTTRSAGSLDTTDLEGRGELRVSKEESDLNSSTGSDLGEGSEDDEFGYDMEEEECKEEESDEDEEAVTLEEDAKRPWSFPRLAQEVFDAFEGRYDQLVEQLSRRIAASPEIAQLYMLRARLYTELGDPLNALRDHDKVWSLMYGHAHVIAENRELMKALFPLLDEQQREEASKIGTYTESQLSHFIKKCEHEHEHDDDDREGDDKDKSMLDSLDRSSGDMFDSTNSPISPRAKGAATSNNPAVITIAPPPLKDESDGEWEYKVYVGKLVSALPATKKIHRREFIDYAVSVNLCPDVYDAKILFAVLTATKKAAPSKFILPSKLVKFVKTVQATYCQTVSWIPRLGRGEVVLRVSSSSVTTTSGARGYMILTNHRLLFAPKKPSKKEDDQSKSNFLLSNIVKVERHNFKIFIPPGLPCLNIHDRTRNYETFCFLSWVERDIWMSCLNEMQVAYEIAIDLSDPRIICHTAHRLMLSEAIFRIKKRYVRNLFAFADFTSQSFYQIAKRLEARGILNTSHSWDINQPVRHACAVSEDLLGAIVALFFAHVLPDGHQVDFKALAASPDFQRFEESSAELQRVNLAQLSAKERTAFFINVYNVLAIHGFVVTGFPRCQLDWRYFARTACYDIAGLPFSLDEIHHGLLRGNRAGPWFSKKRFTDDDPRLQYTIERPDYRVLFALSIHSYSSPCLRLYDADNIEVWLNLATEEYISSNVQILPAKDRQQQQLILPEMLRWYYKDFLEFSGGEADTDASPPSSSPGPLGGAGSSSLTGLLRRVVLPFLSGGKRKALQTLMASEGAPYDVKWIYTWTPSPKPFRQL